MDVGNQTQLIIETWAKSLHCIFFLIKQKNSKKKKDVKYFQKIFHLFFDMPILFPIAIILIRHTTNLLHYII